MTLARKIQPTGFQDRAVADPMPSKRSTDLIRSYLGNCYHIDRRHKTRLGAALYLNIHISRAEWEAATENPKHLSPASGPERSEPDVCGRARRPARLRLG